MVSANFYSLGTRVSPLFLHIFTRGFGSSSKFGKPAFLEKNWWFKHDFQGIFLHKPYQQPKNTWWSSTSTMKNRIHSMENLQQQKSIVSPWLGTEESSFCCVQTWLVFERSMVPSSETNMALKIGARKTIRLPFGGWKAYFQVLWLLVSGSFLPFNDQSKERHALERVIGKGLRFMRILLVLGPTLADFFQILLQSCSRGVCVHCWEFYQTHSEWTHFGLINWILTQWDQEAKWFFCQII